MVDSTTPQKATEKQLASMMVGREVLLERSYARDLGFEEGDTLQIETADGTAYDDRG